MSEVPIIILLGGAAKRMRPLSLDKSKSMIPFLGKPLLFHLIKALKSYNFSDIIFTSSGKQGEIKEYFSDGKNFGVNIKYYNSEKQLGTAGTIKDVISEMGYKVNNSFMVIYGDSLLKANYEKMLQFHVDKKSCCTILYHRPNFESFLYNYHDKNLKGDDERTNYGVIDIDSINQITKVIEKAKITEIRNEFTNPVANATVYILDKKILDFIPTNTIFDFPRDLFPLLVKKGVPCFAFDIGNGYREDIGTIQNYYNIQFNILKGKIGFPFYFPLLNEQIWIGKNSIIKTKENLLKPVLISENCNIDIKTKINCSIIGNNVTIGKYSIIENSIILDNVQIGNKAKISNSIIGEHSMISNGISVTSNTVSGDYCSFGIIDFTE